MPASQPEKFVARGGMILLPGDIWQCPETFLDGRAAGI